jgi:acetyl-CoA synthetase/medium-chain acyl-CoA synthetase
MTAPAPFRWDIPPGFNFGYDAVDVFAADRSRLALLWVREDGRSERHTFWDFKQRSDRFANALAGLGVGRGDPVLLMLPRMPEWQVAFLACLKLGALAIPCTASLRPKDVRFRAAHSGARAVVTTRAGAEIVEAVAADCPALTVKIAVDAPAGWSDFHAVEAAASRALVRVPTRADEPALCFYTSGTTKDPKAVLHAHAYTCAHAATGRYWLDLRRTDLHWTSSDTGWAKAAYGVLFGPWNLGVPILMYDGRFDPARELDLLERWEVSVFCAPPTEYRLLVKQDLGRWKLPRLRHCTGAGEPLNPEVIHAWKDAVDLVIHDGYGQTESILLVANRPGMVVRPGSMGTPFPGHEVAIIDDRGGVLPAGEVGELAVRGRPPSLFLEYWKNPEETAACRRGEWYLTGDRARADEQGYYWFVGRADDVIISAGYRIGPFEVESALLEHPAVLESAVVAAPDEVRGTIVKAYVVVRPEVAATAALAAELQDHVKRVTAPYKYPRAIEFVDALPKTVSGKIRRVELRARAAAAAAAKPPA